MQTKIFALISALAVTIQATNQNALEIEQQELASVESRLRFGDVHQLQFADPRLVDYINSLHSTWQAGHNIRMETMSPEVRQGLASGVRPPKYPRASPPPVHSHFLLGDTSEIPDEFDARTQWGGQCPRLFEVRDQSSCGSCWAFGAVEAMSDRICIASGGRVKVHLSADDLLSCCTQCGYGCDGGEPYEAWEYWVNEGIVTGSNFTTNQGCKPYPFPPCQHHSNRTHFKPCHHELYPTPRCEKKCQEKYQKEYANDKFYGRKAYRVPATVEGIQKEIMSHGPVEAAFTVYEDLLTYKSGVYQHHAGKLDGGHAVKMVGWGVENGTPYWTIVNSWNNDWGDHERTKKVAGQRSCIFKILRGQNECGIESEIVAGLPRLDNHTPGGHHGHRGRGARPHQRNHYRPKKQLRGHGDE